MSMMTVVSISKKLQIGHFSLDICYPLLANFLQSISCWMPLTNVLAEPSTILLILFVNLKILGLKYFALSALSLSTLETDWIFLQFIQSALMKRILGTICQYD